MTVSKAIKLADLPPPHTGSVDLLVIAGEHSGDEQAARVVRDLRALQPELRICALGGPELEGAGAQMLHDLTATSVVGFVEVLKHYPFFKALFAATTRWLARHRPRAVLFVDYPGFNLRLAAEMKRRGLSRPGGGPIEALYYISPQIWAWKPRRRFSMARDLDAMAVIFPFEPGCYADTKLPVEFVGHPFLAADYAPPVQYDASGPILLLPGSRTQAVAKILPVLLAGFAEYRQSVPDARAVVLFPSEEIAGVARKALKQFPAIAGAVTMQSNRGNMPASAVLTSSGTMSLHCALAGIPGAVVYKTKTVTYWLGRMLVSVEFIGMANLLLKEPMYPEFIQGAATRKALARQLQECRENPERQSRTREQASRLRQMLGRPVSGTAAEWLARRMGAVSSKR
ncbi:MAG TPA: lipid-A-disaccharide synthase [Candidatus Didemnitutus sp.]|nr:lipid-A-disaccharide synthase [Candidatus Didemnitutus sp.]